MWFMILVRDEHGTAPLRSPHTGWVIDTRERCEEYAECMRQQFPLYQFLVVPDTISEKRHYNKTVCKNLTDYKGEIR